MIPIIEKYIGKEAFQEKVNSLHGNQEFEKVFTSFLDSFLTDLQDDDAIEDDDTPTSLLTVPTNYINSYVESRQDGFSEIWSERNAYLTIIYESGQAIFSCYNKVAAKSEEMALKDLLVFCKLKDGDKHYIDFLIDHVTKNDYTKRPIEEIAADYSRLYKEQIENGKSAIYAHQYAYLMAESDYHPIYCEDYALGYDQSIHKGKSEEYATRYADKYASELVDVKRRAGSCDVEEILDFAKVKAIAYINGWEYARDNKLKER